MDNNSNFAFRVVTEWQSTATYQTAATSVNTNVLGVNGVFATNFWVGVANSYSSGFTGTNSAGGTVSYDLVCCPRRLYHQQQCPSDHRFLPDMPVTSLGLPFTNMVVTNVLTLNFTANSSQMPASNLTFTVQPVNTVAVRRR